MTDDLLESGIANLTSTKSEVWRQVLRARLRKVPLASRQSWSDKQFIDWLLNLKSRRKALWTKLPSFSIIKQMCGDLIGTTAKQ